MTPADLRALLDKATPRPWRADVERGTIFSDPPCEYMRFVACDVMDDDPPMIATLANLADKLVELWESAVYNLAYTDWQHDGRCDVFRFGSQPGHECTCGLEKFITAVDALGEV